MIAKEGSVTKAALKLNLTQPTLSAQVRSLEQRLGGPLFARAGRGLRLTHLGQTAFGYAEEIFGLGQELLSAARGAEAAGPQRFAVGVSDEITKPAVFHLLKPALDLPEPVRLVCLEEGFDRHIQLLLNHQLDLVLSDAPLGAHVGPRAYNHLLGEADMKLYGTRELIDRHPGPFPACLRGAPFLVPPAYAANRRALDHWFDLHDLQPRIIAEIADGALLKTFAAEGRGFALEPALLAQTVAYRYSLFPIGTVEGLKGRVYAISVERRLKHPAVLAIQQAAVREVFV